MLFNRRDDSGTWGDVILVNGVPWPLMKVQRRKYRFRLLNASISRSFKLFLSTGDPLTVVATDGGLMPAAQVVPSLRHGSGERYEVVIDFSKYRPGQRVVLRNTSPKNNDDYANTNKIMAFEVTDAPVDTSDPSALGPVPSVLASDNSVMNLKVADAVAKRTMMLERQNGKWTINGTTWEKVVNSGYTKVEGSPVEGSVEMWTLSNPHGGWNHPFHIHLIDFKIVDRNGRPPFAFERGPKDVVYLGENETVRVLARFEGGRGKYMMHCHNLIHEDHDMMSQFEVVAPGKASPDPLSDRCKDLPDTDWHA